MSTKSRRRDKEDRVYLRIDAALKKRMQEYCDRYGTNMSLLVTQHFHDLLVKEKREQSMDADQF